MAERLAEWATRNGLNIAETIRAAQESRLPATRLTAREWQVDEAVPGVKEWLAAEREGR